MTDNGTHPLFEDMIQDYLIEAEPDDDIIESGPSLMRDDVPDALFASSNEWGVPDLDMTMQAQYAVLPVLPWGSLPRHSAKMRGTWCFYVDDYKFNALWTNPAPVVNTRCINAVEPNVSTNDQMPPAVALWGVYRKRWIARWWQSVGVRVFVDLNVSERYREMNLLGVPRGWLAYATRGIEAMGTEPIDADYAIACERAGTTPLFMVYGGRKVIQAHCMERGYIWVPELAGRVRKDGANG